MAPVGQAPVVVAEGLIKNWGTRPVLTGATFAIRPGVTGLLGANGSGKTTFLGMVLGFHQADGGHLSVFGLDPSSSGPEVRARIGYAAEHEALPPDVRAHDYVRHVAELHGIGRRDAIARASDALFEVGLGEERFRPLGTMSTGQKQRVKLAQAIVHDPALVLLDEPTNGLDPMQRDSLLALVKRCGSELGLNVVLSSHLLDEVDRTCDHVVILADGVATNSGDVSDLEGEAAFIDVVVEGDPAVAVHALNAAGLRAAIDQSRRQSIEIAYGSEATFDQIAAALAGATVPVRSLGRRRRTLEDAFLAATGGAG
jgi:ABC-2 type transport system ATP-binding protein